MASAAIAIAALATFGLGSAQAASLTVCPTGCTATTIQGAVTVAESGTPGTLATITVASGSYPESIKIQGAVSISIVGAGVGKTTIEAVPSAILGNALSPAEGPTVYPVIDDYGAPTVSLTGLTIDGLDDGSTVASDAGRPFVAVAEYNGNLSLNDVNITGFSDSPPDSQATGIGVYAVNDGGPGMSSLSVTNSTISDYQQAGIEAIGNADLSVNIAGDTISGNGGPANADGIDIAGLPASAAAGPSGSIESSTVTGNVSATTQSILDHDSVNGAGIRLAGVGNFTVSGDTVLGNDVGVWSSAATGATVTVTGNELENSTQADALAGYGSNVVTGNTIGSLANATQTPIGVLVADYKEDDPEPGATATVSANTISGTNSAVEVAVGTTAGAPLPDATITNNALFGNTNGIENATTATVDGIDNWWGCNGGPDASGCPQILYPQGAADGRVTAAPYLVFAVVGAPASITPGSSTTVIASIRQDSAGTAFASGPFPSGLPVTLGTTAGSLPSSATLSDGEAAVALSGTPLGTATLSGTLESATVTSTVTTANAVSTASSTAPSTITVTVPVPATVAPLISFIAAGKLSLLASNPGGELTVTCIDGCGASVTGTIALNERKGKRVVHKTLTLSAITPTIAADGSYAYAVTLTASQRSVLTHALSATLTLNVSAKDDSTGKTVTDSKTFNLTRH
jgi:hypothetical protein